MTNRNTTKSNVKIKSKWWCIRCENNTSLSYKKGEILRIYYLYLRLVLEIIYQDDSLIAINKPHGLLVHRSKIADDAKEFALQMLRDQIGRHVNPVHRLDRKTGGVLLFAFDKEVEIAVDMYKMAAAKVSFDDIINAVRYENKTVSGGSVSTNGIKNMMASTKFFKFKIVDFNYFALFNGFVC